MLIPTSFQRLPNVSGCYNGQLLFGGAIAQMASAAAQLTRVKFLGEAHYNINRGVGTDVVGTLIGGRFRIIEPNAFKATTTNHYLYQSTPISSHLGIIIQYVSANFAAGANVSIELELRDTASNSYSGTTLDVGCRFTEVDLQSDPNTLLTTFTGADLIAAPSNVTPDPPRVLYVPSANRGELLNVAVTTNNLVVLGLHIYDIYDPEVTP
ncbi:MAG: hypothetical protein ACO4AA_02330 [Aquiluna sp.]|jgi:hypothetical protein